MYDTIVVGAGISGIYAVREILKKNPGSSVALVERYKGLGGRTYSYKHGDVHWEMGAGRIHKSHKHTIGLIEEYDLTLIPISSSLGYKESPGSDIIENPFESLSQVYIEPLKKLSADVLSKSTLESLMYRIYGPKITNNVLSYFPYFGEVRVLRADLALKTFFGGEMSSHSGYFVIKEGFSELIANMVKDIEGRGCIILNRHKLLNIKYNDGVNECIFDKKTLKAKKVILALHSDAVASLPVFKGWKTLTYLKTQPLLRIYGIFDDGWFAGLGNVVTPGPLRYIIPVGPKAIMLSYTDGDDTKDYLRTQMHRGDKALEKVIMGQIRGLFPEKKIADPVFFKSHPWDTGATYWLPGSYNPEVVSLECIHPLSTLPKVWLCGESWSLRQAWVEGALEHTILCLSEVDRR
jgi:hypothetical protein